MKPPSRRRFLGWAWLGLLGVAVLEWAWVVADFLRPRPARAATTDAIFVAGPEERFEHGSVTAFRRGRFYLARLEDGGFLALSRECTHLGCTVPWIEDEGRFLCPCHSSAFDIRGVVQSLPAPRPLDLHPVRIENGVVKVDTGTRVRRKAFDVSQVARA